MPFTFLLGLRWEPIDGRISCEARVLHAARADRLSTRDENDTSRIPPGGTPGYTILDLIAGYDVNQNLSLQAGLENITDADYRVHGSGTNGVGRNLFFGLRLSF